LLIAAAIGTASVLFILAIVQPWAKLPDMDENVAAAWNKSISSLGIKAIYPPEEDRYVGDIFLVITGTGTGNDPDPTLGNGVKIAHIDLGSLVAGDQESRVHFVDESPITSTNTEKGKTDETAHDTKSKTMDKNTISHGISLSLVAFPGVTLTHTRKASTAFLGRWLGWDSASDRSTTEEISIPTAYTYGVQPIEAFNHLSRWCDDPNTGWECQDQMARYIMEVAGIPKVQERNEDTRTYRYNIELCMITRVYMTKVIVQRHIAGDSSGGSVGVSADVGASKALLIQNTDEDTVNQGKRTSSDPQTTPDSSSTRNQTGSFSLTTKEGSTIVLSQTYDRPLVFGYRAVSLPTYTVKPSLTGANK
jgi:hypothetical protein